MRKGGNCNGASKAEPAAAGSARLVLAMTDARWLSLPRAAEHLDISVDALRRLVRAGKLPEPDRTLGQRMPRWDREALDKAMSGASSSRDPDVAVEAWVEKQRQRPRRAANPG
jgi:predicted DNA-binding transcriptional regulator AlpA